MDESNISSRINQIIEKEGLTVSSFARRINVADQTVRSVCTLHRNKPGYDFIAAIIHSFEWLNAEWLITGKGEMKKKDDDCCSCTRNGPDAVKELVAYLREKDEQIKNLIEEKTEWKVKYEISQNVVAPKHPH